MALLLTHQDVAEVATTDVAIDAMRNVFQLEGEGQAERPQRFDIAHRHGWLRLMPVVVPGLDVFGFKAMNLTQWVGVRYAIWIYSLGDGSLQGILDAKLVTAMRTAATSAVATDVLCRPNTERTAIIGTGAEARTHLLAMQAVRPAAKIMVFSRSHENRRVFIEDMKPLVDTDLVECGSVDEALSGVDLVVLATKSPTSMLLSHHLEAGMHVNSIGSARMDQFELAEDTFPLFSTIVCDSIHHVFSEAGDAVAALERGEVSEAQAADLGDVMVGRGRGRSTDEEITLFKSVGTAVQDIGLASRVLALASEHGIGRNLGDFPYLKSFL